VGSWLPTYLASFFASSKEKISQGESNRQPLHLEMGTSQTTKHCNIFSNLSDYVFEISDEFLIIRFETTQLSQRCHPNLWRLV
jgi:hypothetical protein